MKRILFIVVALMMNTLVHSQDREFPRNEAGIIEITETVDNSLSKDEMISNFKYWLATNFSNISDAIQFEDTGAGRMVAKLRIAAGHTSLNNKDVSTDLTFTLTIEFRDNRYRFVIDDVLTHGRIFQGGGVPRFYNDTPYKHFKHIEQYQQKIDQYKADGTITEKEQRATDACLSEIEREKTLFNAEYDELFKCIDTLKSSLLKKSDF